MGCDIVSGLNQKNDPLQIIYGNSHGRCNLRGIGGIDNILAVIEKLLNDHELTKIRLSDLEPNKRRAKMLSYLLDKFSRNDVEFSWHIAGKSTSLKNHGDVTITVNGQDLFTWHISPSHFDFKVIQNTEGTDWRKDNNTLTQLLESNLDKPLKKQLLSFYLSHNDHQILTQNTHYRSFAPEILFGSSLNGGEEIISALDIALSLNPEISLQLALKWLSNLPDALSVNHLVAKLINKHREVLDPQNNPYLKPVFTRIINSLKQLDDPSQFEEISKYLKIPGFDQYMIEVLKNRTPAQIASLKSKRKETLLHVACKKGRLAFAKFLLKHAGSELLSPKNLKAKEGITPLNLAAAKVHDSIVEVLMTNDLTRTTFLNPKNIEDSLGCTPLILAARNKRDNIVKILLNDKEFRPLLLNPKHAQDNVIGYSPLHWAAKNNSIEIIHLLLSIPEAKKTLLSDDYWYSTTDEKRTPIDITTDNTLKELLSEAKEQFEN